MALSAELADAVSSGTGIELVPSSESAIGGGSINRVLKVADTDGRSWLLKLNDVSGAAMFAAEVAGLEALASADAVRVPKPVGSGSDGTHAYLLMEWLELGPGIPAAARTLGHGLARLHRVSDEYFGWDRDNTIGSTPQENARETDWVRFFRERRLRFQLRLAEKKGYGGEIQEQGERLCDQLDMFFDDYRPVPSLLHGDLWGGNWGVTTDGEPAIFDPAVYFGDREADIAMTKLFGGFDAGFYSAYSSAWPMHRGAALRLDLYNLYHVLNHLNLFGGGYRAQALGMIRRLIAAVGG